MIIIERSDLQWESNSSPSSEFMVTCLTARPQVLIELNMSYSTLLRHHEIKLNFRNFFKSFITWSPWSISLRRLVSPNFQYLTITTLIFMLFGRHLKHCYFSLFMYICTYVCMYECTKTAATWKHKKPRELFSGQWTFVT